MVTITFDPTVAADVTFIQRRILDLLPSTATSGGNTGDTPDLATKVADDLLRRLGKEGSELFTMMSEFDQPFTLVDVQKRTDESISKIKSRWANLSRSIAQTRKRFGNIEIFKEQIPDAKNNDGYFLFLMDEGIRDAVRKRRR